MGTTTEFLVDKYYCGLTLPRIIVWNFAISSSIETMVEGGFLVVNLANCLSF